MALEVERQGLSFYRACAQESKLADVKEVFHFLIEQEMKHMEVFSEMKSRLPDNYKLPESYPGENRSYLNCLVQDRVFSTSEEAAAKVRDISDPTHAVNAAIEFEKASILFYSGFKQMVRPSDHDEIEKIIVEEHFHVRRLMELRRDLTDRSG